MRSKWTEEQPSGTMPSAENGVEKVAYGKQNLATLIWLTFRSTFN